MDVWAHHRAAGAACLYVYTYKGRDGNQNKELKPESSVSPLVLSISPATAGPLHFHIRERNKITSIFLNRKFCLIHSSSSPLLGVCQLVAESPQKKTHTA